MKQPPTIKRMEREFDKYLFSHWVFNDKDPAILWIKSFFRSYLSEVLEYLEDGLWKAHRDEESKEDRAYNDALDLAITKIAHIARKK